MPRTATIDKNPRLQRFVANIASGTMSKQQAWISAGYSPANASGEAAKALEKPVVKAAVEARRALLERTNTQANPEFVMSTLVREAQGAGPDTTSAARVSAAKVLADIFGLSNSQAQATEGFTTLLEALGRGLRQGNSLKAPVEGSLDATEALPAGKQDATGASYRVVEDSADGTESGE